LIKHLIKKEKMLPSEEGSEVNIILEN